MATVHPAGHSIEMATLAADDGVEKVKVKGSDQDEEKKGIVGKAWKTLTTTVEKDKAMEPAKEKGVGASFMVVVWLIAKAVYVIVLVYLTWLATTTDQAKKYLSPDFKFGGSKGYRL